MDFDHNKLIAEVAKQTLLPAGLRRKGKSRVYYDDNGWWCTIVEFQPSGFSKGSYLNVGICWLLYEKDYWSFNVGTQEGNDRRFVSAKNENEFSNAVFEKAMRAKEIAENNRERFFSVSKAHEYYQSIKREGWDFYYSAVIAGLNREFTVAVENFNSWLAYPETTEWQKEANSRARELMYLLERPREFVEAVTKIVSRTRALLRLENKDGALLGLPLVEEF
ncbi:MAG: hypothetical protein ACLPYZ_04045 [Limisphaerales bacterium]